jgi:hypothetical protein
MISVSAGLAVMDGAAPAGAGKSVHFRPRGLPDIGVLPFPSAADIKRQR